MSDLVERLIEAASKGKPDGNMMLASSELFAAAHLINNQADEIERLRAEVADLNGANGMLLRQASNMEAERDRLRQRCKNYRRALRQLNKAHNVLWRVLQISYDRRAKEARDAALGKEKSNG